MLIKNSVLFESKVAVNYIDNNKMFTLSNSNKI